VIFLLILKIRKSFNVSRILKIVGNNYDASKIFGSVLTNLLPISKCKGLVWYYFLSVTKLGSAKNCEGPNWVFTLSSIMSYSYSYFIIKCIFGLLVRLMESKRAILAKATLWSFNHITMALILIYSLSIKTSWAYPTHMSDYIIFRPMFSLLEVL